MHGFAGRCVATPPRRLGHASLEPARPGWSRGPSPGIGSVAGTQPGPPRRPRGVRAEAAAPRRLLVFANSRAISSAGRAPARQAGGHWFEPSIAHLETPANAGVSSFRCQYRGSNLPLDVIAAAARGTIRAMATTYIRGAEFHGLMLDLVRGLDTRSSDGALLGPVVASGDGSRLQAHRVLS